MVLNFQTIIKIVKPNKYNKYDGIIVYVKTNLEYKVLDTEIDHTKFMNFIITYRGLDLYCTALYRSPNNIDIFEFFGGLGMFLEQTKHNSNRILVADTNINILEEHLTLSGHNYLDILSEHGFVDYLCGRTRVSPTC